jgi:uncharacterized protein YqgC (DUF456 family)
VVDILVAIIAGLVMLIGIAGSIVPILPDIILVWGAALGYGLLVGWGERGVWFFGVITLLGLLGLAPEIWVSGAGAKAAGASIWAVLGGFALGVVGLILSGPLGGVVGLLFGTYLAELLRLGEAKEAAQSMLGIGLGCGASFVVKLVLGLGMFVTWILWVVLG